MLVLGGGVAGLSAIQTAKHMGALVSAYDVRPAAKEQVTHPPTSAYCRDCHKPTTRCTPPQVESMGGKFLKVNFEEDGSGAGGYAKEMSNECVGPPPNELPQKQLCPSYSDCFIDCMSGG